jgi:streptomycin 6-kinase
MIFTFRDEEILKIKNRFGNQFYITISTALESLISKWYLANLVLIDSFSASLVFRGVSKVHGPVVMKFGVNGDEFLSEVSALKSFNGQGACKLIDYDLERKVLLEEFIYPGTELSKEKSIEKRLEVFCGLHKELYSSGTIRDKVFGDITRESEFKSYKDWILRIADYMKGLSHWQDLSFHMEQAKNLYLDLLDDYPEECLLHGDFHYYNILKSDKTYKIIDPKGVMGNPIFDIPRYMLNEFWDQEDKSKLDETMEVVFSYISSKLNIPKSVLSKLLYIEGTMAICWCVQDGADLNEKEEFVDMLEKLQMYMSKYAS